MLLDQLNPSRSERPILSLKVGYEGVKDYVIYFKLKVTLSNKAIYHMYNPNWSIHICKLNYIGRTELMSIT